MWWWLITYTMVGHTRREANGKAQKGNVRGASTNVPRDTPIPKKESESICLAGAGT